MVLRMARPNRHPKTGIFQFRKGVPERLRPLVGKTEEKISLGTRDPQEAKIAHARVAAEVEARWARLGQGALSLSHMEAVGLAGEIYRSMIEANQENPDRIPGRVAALMLDRAFLKKGNIRIIPMGMNPDATKALLERLATDRNAPLVDAWLSEKGILLDAESRTKVLAEVDKAALQAREQLERMMNGDYRQDPDAGRFPKFELDKPKPKERARASNVVTFDAIVDAQAAKRRAGKTPKPMPDTSVKKYKRLANEFASFRGSDDATTVTLAEVEEWGDSLLEAAQVGNRTIAGKLTNLGTIINWGKHQRKHRDAMRAAEIISGQIELPTYVEKSADETSYTMEEARRVLAAARRETEVRKRWLPWLCLYAGLRISEANALRKSDFFQSEGLWFFKVTTAGRRSVKTPRSDRRIPVHPVLAEEGLLDWVRTAREERLFPRGATSLLGRWVRSKHVRLARAEASPNHGLRHLFAGLCRRHNLDSEAAEYLSGHASAKVHAKYGSTDVMLPGLFREMEKIIPLIPAKHAGS